MKRIKTITVKASLRIYNKAREHGWTVAWVGEGKMCFKKAY